MEFWDSVGVIWFGRWGWNIDSHWCRLKLGGIDEDGMIRERGCDGRSYACVDVPWLGHGQLDVYGQVAGMTSQTGCGHDTACVGLCGDGRPEGLLSL